MLIPLGSQHSPPACMHGICQDSRSWLQVSNCRVVAFQPESKSFLVPQVADFGLSRELNFQSRMQTVSYGTVGCPPSATNQLPHFVKLSRRP